MGGMCRIGARQSNALPVLPPGTLESREPIDRAGFGTSGRPMPLFRSRDTRYSGYPAQPAGALPARTGRGFPRDPGRNEPRPAQVSPGIRFDESTVIKYLSMAGGDPEQAARLR